MLSRTHLGVVLDLWIIEGLRELLVHTLHFLGSAGVLVGIWSHLTREMSGQIKFFLRSNAWRLLVKRTGTFTDLSGRR